MKSINLNIPNEIMAKAYADVITRCPEVAVVSMFPQTWDTPALGFLGVAAAQDSVAYTIVFTSTDPNCNTCYVYFDGRYAYTVFEPNEEFGMHIVNHNLGSILFRDDYEVVTKMDEDDGQAPDSLPQE